MISYSQDWARLLYVGDTLFNIVLCTVPDEQDEEKRVPCVFMEYRWNGESYYIYKICLDEAEQLDYFQNVGEEELTEIMLQNLD